MAIKQLQDQIKGNLIEFKTLDLSVLSSEGKNIQPPPNYSGSEIKLLTDDIERILNHIENNPENLNQFNYTYLRNFNNQLNTFIAQFKPIEKIDIEQLRSQHHGPINQLESLNVTLRQSGIYSILSPSVNIPRIEKELNELRGQADVIVKDAQDNAEIIRGLIPEATATSLSVAIDERAKQLTVRVSLWLGFVISVLVLSSIFSWYFLNSNDEKSVVQPETKKLVQNLKDSVAIKSDSLVIKSKNKVEGKILKNNREYLKENESESLVYWIKRIVVFLPIFYLIVFCIRQYNKERKLLEIYIHKKTIGQTLPAYMKQAKKEDIMDEILLRGSSMIFTLPENPNSPIQGSDGVAMSELKGFLDIKDKLTNK